MRRILDRRAEGYIGVCVMTVVICMIISSVLFFVQTWSVTKVVRDSAQNVLDSYVMEKSVEIYNSVKCGNDLTGSVDSDRFTEMYTEYMGMSPSSGEYVSADESGDRNYSISKPVLSYLDDGKLGVYADFTVSYPVTFAGVYLFDCHIPLRICSDLKDRFG